MKNRLVLWSLVVISTILIKEIEGEDVPDVPIHYYTYNANVNPIEFALYVDLTAAMAGNKPPDKATLTIQYTPTLMKEEVVSVPSTNSPTVGEPLRFELTKALSTEPLKLHIILELTKDGEIDGHSVGEAYFTTKINYIDAAKVPTTANLFGFNTLNEVRPYISFKLDPLVVIDFIFTKDDGITFETPEPGDDDTLYVSYTGGTPTEINFCLNDDDYGIPNCAPTPIHLDNPPETCGAEVQDIVCTIDDASSVKCSLSKEVPEGTVKSAMFVEDKIVGDWTADVTIPDITADGRIILYTFIDNTAACTSGSFNVLDFTIESLTTFIEVRWDNNQMNPSLSLLNLYLMKMFDPSPPDDDFSSATKEYHVDCTSSDLNFCNAYYFPDAKLEVGSKTVELSPYIGDDPANPVYDIHLTRKSIDITATAQKETTSMEIVSSNVSNKKNSEVCVFDQLMPTTNSSEFSYELVVANYEGAWKKYSSYTKKDQSLCFSIQLPADKFMPNSQIHLAAIKRDVKKRSISSSSYVRTFLAEPKVKLLNADVAKVELEGVGHKFLIRDAETHKVITRDVQKKGLEAYIRVDQKNGGVSNKEFIMEMRDGRMVSRVQFKTPEYKAVSE